MTSPKHAGDTEVGRYYVHPKTGQQLVSVTNILSTAVAKPVLVPWAAKIVAEHAVTNWPQLTTRLRLDPDGVTRDLKQQVTIARDKAADLGTRIHAMADAHVTGRPVPDDPEAAPYLAQYLKFLADFGVDLEHDVEAAELTVARPADGWAGTLDLLLRLCLDGFIPGQGCRPVEDGKPKGLFLIDIKTSATRAAGSVYGEYALQLTALRNATEAWLPNDEIWPMTKGITGAAILNLRQRTYELIPLPTGPAEYQAFQGALAATKWLHTVGKDIGAGEYRPVGPSGRAKPKRTRTNSKTTTTTEQAA